MVEANTTAPNQSQKFGNLLGTSHPDTIKIEYPQILSDVASTSHASFGNFIP